MHNVRLMMEPNTATKLKTRKRNVLKDYVAMAGPFGVTHLLAFNKTKAGTNLVRQLGPPAPPPPRPVASLVRCRRRLTVVRALRFTMRVWRVLRSPPRPAPAPIMAAHREAPAGTDPHLSGQECESSLPPPPP